MLSRIIRNVSGKKSVVSKVLASAKCEHDFLTDIDNDHYVIFLRDQHNALDMIKGDIRVNQRHINQLSTSVLTQAVSGLIWLVTSYSLNILQMTKGKVASIGGDTPNTDTHRSIHKMSFEDLMLISKDAMRMGLYATGIQFFLASVLLHKKNQCEFTPGNKNYRS